MGQFIAILKDSFREAVDGFVIYLMLGLSALLIVLAASISYAPNPPAEALPELVEQFGLVFPDRGASTSPTGSPVKFRYKVSEVRETPNGATFVLAADPRTTVPKKGPDGERVKGPDGQDVTEEVMPKGGLDGFRYAVYAWKQPAGEKLKKPFADGRGRNKGGPPTGRTELELVMPPKAGADDLRAVTDEDMAAFLKYQFATFAGTDQVTVARRPGVAEPEYQFDVTLAGISGARGWPHAVHTLFGAVPPIKNIPLGLSLYFIQNQIVNGIGAAVTLMISVVITAFFIPNMMRKGSVDLLISKPIGRTRLLVYKYVGGLTFIFLLSAFSVGGVWLAMAARSGAWDPSFLLLVPALTFTFAILYAVSTAVGVFTRSAIAAILITLVFMFLLYVLGQVKAFFDMNRVTGDNELPEWSYTLVDTLNNVLPRYKDMDKLTGKLVADSTMPTGLARLTGVFTEYPSWGGAVGVSLAFIAVMLALSCWRFSRRDY